MSTKEHDVSAASMARYVATDAREQFAHYVRESREKLAALENTYEFICAGDTSFDVEMHAMSSLSKAVKFYNADRTRTETVVVRENG